MAVVHFGRQTGIVGFSRVVAIKRMHAQYAGSSEFVAAFLDEARLASRVQHPNVLPVLDVVRDGDELFIVMEYVNGEALSELLRASRDSGERVPARVATAILIDVLHGLHAAHEAKSEKGAPLGIVHRDVSPHNVMVGVDGAARVLDFGVARAAGRLQTTRAGQVKGKVAYMSPEQVLANEVTRQSDVYSAGVVLWETLSGRRLFHKESAGGVLYDILEGPIDPPSKHRADVPPALDAIAMRALERNVRVRWSTARDFALALERETEHATSSEVGAWVEKVAHAALEKRRAEVEEIERISLVDPIPVRSIAGDVTETDAGVVAAPQGVRATSAVAGARSEAAGRGPARAIAIAAGAIALAAIGVYAFLARASKEAPSSTSPPPPAVTSSSPAAAAPSAIVAAAPVSASTAPPLPPTPPIVTAARVPPRASASTSVKPPSCDPPWIEGADGIRRPKQGCY